MNFKFAIAALSLIFAAINHVAFAGDSVWVEKEGMSGMENITKEEARRRSIVDAMRNAVEEVAGSHVKAETFVRNYRFSGEIIKLIPYGRVTEKEIIEEGIKEIREKGMTTPSLIYRVKIRAKVVREAGNADPYFKVKGEINRGVFKEGDEMEIKVMGTKDCHLLILNILEDDRVLMLAPNRYRKDNHVTAEQPFTFPDEKDKKGGLSLKLHLPQGKNETTETIHFLCTKEPLNLSPKFQEGIFGVYNDSTAFIQDLVSEIVEIPLSERAEDFLQYSITQ